MGLCQAGLMRLSAHSAPRYGGTVIRHILLIKLKPEATSGQVEAFMREIAAVPFPGRTNIVVGRDLGLRPGNFELAVSNDFPDEGAYHAWGEDAAHGEVRASYLQPIAGDIARCLFEV
jgi:Stress responsive A/B Barrel Domain